MLKQVRTKNNTYNTVQYDSDGNILTPARRRELRKLNKGKHKQEIKKTNGLNYLVSFRVLALLAIKNFILAQRSCGTKKIKKPSMWSAL